MKVRLKILAALCCLLSMSIFDINLIHVSAVEGMDNYELSLKESPDTQYVHRALDSFKIIAQEEHLLDLNDINNSIDDESQIWKKIDVEAFIAQEVIEGSEVLLEENRLVYDHPALTAISYQFINSQSLEDEMVDLMTVYFEDALIYVGITFYNQHFFSYTGDSKPLAYSITKLNNTKQEVLLKLVGHLSEEKSLQLSFSSKDKLEKQIVETSFSELMVSIQPIMLTHHFEDFNLLSDEEQSGGNILSNRSELEIDTDSTGSEDQGSDQGKEEAEDDTAESPLNTDLSNKEMLSFFLPSDLDESHLLEADYLQKNFESLQEELSEVMMSNADIIDRLLDLEAMADITASTNADVDASETFYDFYTNPVQTDPFGNPIFFDVYGYPLQLNPIGHPLLIDINGAPLQVDENGFPIFYNAYGNPYENDEDGNLIFYDESQIPIIYERELIEENEDTVYELELLDRTTVINYLGQPIESIALLENSQKDNYFALSEEKVILLELMYVEKELISLKYQEYTPSVYLPLEVNNTRVNQWQEELPLKLSQLIEDLGSPQSHIYFLGSNNYYVSWETFHNNEPEQIITLIEGNNVIDIIMNN